MALQDELRTEVAAIFNAPDWDVVDTNSVPEPADLLLDSAYAKRLEATVLYADMDGSTGMVDDHKWWFSAEVYKAYLRCAARIIPANGGVITAYDGDRIMAIFVGTGKNTSAARAAFSINYAVENIVQPALSARYATTPFKLGHTIGIDTGTLHATRVGIRGNNDITWVGKAANYAAKLTAISAPTKMPIWATEAVHDALNVSMRLKNGQACWIRHTWDLNGSTIYASDWLLNFAG